MKAIDRGRWPYTTVGDVMRSLETLRSIGPERPVAEALEMDGPRGCKSDAGRPAWKSGGNHLAWPCRARATDTRGTRHLNAPKKVSLTSRERLRQHQPLTLALL